MSLRTTVLLLPLVTGCGVFCHDPGELAIDVYDHDYAPIDDVQVEVTSDSGEAVALDGDGTSWYASGLKPGEKVIAEGTQKVKDGSTVNPQPFEPAVPADGKAAASAEKPAAPAPESKG